MFGETFEGTPRPIDQGQMGHGLVVHHNNSLIYDAILTMKRQIACLQNQDD